MAKFARAARWMDDGKAAFREAWPGGRHVKIEQGQIQEYTGPNDPNPAAFTPNQQDLMANDWQLYSDVAADPNSLEHFIANTRGRLHVIREGQADTGIKITIKSSQGGQAVFLVNRNEVIPQ